MKKIVMWIVLFIVLILLTFVFYAQTRIPSADRSVVWSIHKGKDNINGKDYSVNCKVFGYALNPPKYKWNKPSNKWDWTFAVVILLPWNQNTPPSHISSTSSDDFSIGESTLKIDHSKDRKVLIYSDEEGNIRQLTINKSDPIFSDSKLSFLTESYTPKMSAGTSDPKSDPLKSIQSSQIFDFWEHLQSYNDRSTIFLAAEK